MSEKRQPKVLIVAGSKNSGKTYATVHFELKYYVRQINNQQARPVIILDVQGEYSKFKAISYNVDIENNFERTKSIRKIKRASIYRLLAKHPNGVVYSSAQIIQACTDITTNFKNGLFLMEDINRYMTSQIPDNFYSHLISVRHEGVDLILHYQRVSDPPPRITGNAEYLRLHRTSDSITKKSVADKYSNPEIIRIAELIIEKEYFRGNIYYFIYIDLMGSKLLNISPPDFEIAARTYLYENYSIVTSIMKRKNEQGIKLFSSENEAINFLINQKKALYLSPPEKTKILVKKQNKSNKKTTEENK